MPSNSKNNVNTFVARQVTKDIIFKAFNTKIEALYILDNSAAQPSLKNMEEELIGRIDGGNLKHGKIDIVREEGGGDTKNDEIASKGSDQLDKKELNERQLTSGWHHREYGPLPSTRTYPKRCALVQLI